MRFIKYFVIHCSAGYGSWAAIQNYWRSLGWKTDGYHYYILTDGTIIEGVPLDQVSNGVGGFNTPSVHISYQGGVARDNYKKAVDTRTPEQKDAILECMDRAFKFFKQYQAIDGIKILGHRDFSPDKNLNGMIDANERIKECPSFDAIPEYAWLRGSRALASKTILSLLLPLLLLVGCGALQKSKQKDRTRTEQSAVVEVSGMSEKEIDFNRISFEKWNGTERSLITYFNPVGRFGDKGFEGKADSVTEERQTTNQGEKAGKEAQKTKEKEAFDSKAKSEQTADVEKEDLNVHREPPSTFGFAIKYLLPVFLLFVVGLIVVYDKPRKVVLSFFKSLLKSN